MNTILAPTSVADLLDRITILTLKAEKLNADVSLELNALEAVELELKLSSPVQHLKQILYACNAEGWCIEDDKRECERTKTFDEQFINHARSVYIINDLRATVKRQINTLANSPIQEYKSHEDYL